MVVRIGALGHLGDGIAEVDGETHYVPFALPGEDVLIGRDEAGRIRLVEVLTPAAERVAAVCDHFGTCGGCALQHLVPPAYTVWKRDQVAAALGARGLETNIAPLIPVAPGTRRRASFAATRTRKGATLGYYARESHRVVAVRHCPVVVPEIERALPTLAELVAPGFSRKARGSLLVTATDTGLDVQVTGGKADPDLAERQRLAEGAATADLTRLAWDDEVVAERRKPLVRFSGIAVAPPPGAFLQASAASESVLVSLVKEGAGAARHAVDLFAGCGTFTFALARDIAMRAIDSEAAQLQALSDAARVQGPDLGLKPIATEIRDLFRRPLLADELKNVDTVVFDPPRVGAKAQAEALADSSVPRIVAVSCNPATFARDARSLVDGGYRLDRVTPVDQFLWSPHIELVGVFSRD